MRGIRTGIVAFLTLGLLTVSTVGVVARSDTTAQESTSARPIELPAQIPKGVDTGSLKTPLGPARWVHLSGDPAGLPPRVRDVTSTPEGFILLEWLDDGATLWRSPDLFTWTSQPLDIPAWSGLSYAADGTYWLQPGDVLWRSQDTELWEQVDFAGLAPPQRDGYAYAFHLAGTPLEHDGVTIASYGWGADYGVVTRDHRLAEQAYGLTETEPGVYKLGHRRDDVPTVRFEEIDTGVRMVDHEDGTELKVLDGISMEFVERLGSDDGIPAIPGLVIVDGDELVDVELPDSMRLADSLTFTTDGPGFTAYAVTDGLMTVHRSQDGRDWRQIATIGDDAREPTDVESVVMWIDPTSMQTTDGGWWTTTDGLTWRERPHDAAHRFADGWIRPSSKYPMWYYPDRGKVVRIDHSAVGLPLKRECSGSPRPISSNTLHMSCKRDGVRDSWIITFDDVPA